METGIFPRCCGLNILFGFPTDDTVKVNGDYSLLAIPKTIKDYETGEFGISYCATRGKSPYVRAHILAVTDKQKQSKAVLETLGYRVLGSVPSAHSTKDPGGYGFYRIYLMGKGFEEVANATRQL